MDNGLGIDGEWMDNTNRDNNPDDIILHMTQSCIDIIFTLKDDQMASLFEWDKIIRHTIHNIRFYVFV